ncbi:hypothetical protein KIN20_003383 [Parelaphostrongylus tenuis]|uniref:N-acetyltransferase domain-containing protein n=1 Tax=Parelaphostrongylus tenuis TaxID=148309 RepID=A0AAD5MPV3_PARTN|nr:hypothetical protein KIN20_003383 [Parelaphostrongylus tenuis]
MATLVASSSSESTNNSKTTTKTKSTESGSTTLNQKFTAVGNNTPTAFCTQPPPNTRVEALPNELEVIEFLREHFIPNEPILSSLCISNTDELNVLLSDLVNDCITCPASNVIRDIGTGRLLGVCLASRSCLFEKQMDRLFSYEFSDPQLCIAIEFLKSVFNRADVAYHLEENGITKPVFVAIIAVDVSFWRKGIGSALLDNCLSSAVEDHCDGALALCSSSRANRLMLKRFRNVVCRTRYCDYRGEYRNPPIAPPPPESALHVLLTKL